MSEHEVLAVRLIREITFVETLEKARSGKAIRWTRPSRNRSLPRASCDHCALHPSLRGQPDHPPGRAAAEAVPAAVPSLELWDHGYNEPGLADGSGSPLGAALPIPHDDTDPGGLLAILQGIAAGEPWAGRARTFDILILTSRFPHNAIVSEAGATSLKARYQEIREVALALPQAVLLCPPHPSSSRPAGPARRHGQPTSPGGSARTGPARTWGTRTSLTS